MQETTRGLFRMDQVEGETTIDEAFLIREDGKEDSGARDGLCLSYVDY